MKRPYLVWYVLALVVALALAGLRVFLWRTAKPQAVDAAMVRAGQTLFTHVWKANDPLANGGEVMELYCFVFLYMAAVGAGPWSLDAQMKRA